ncbi:granzyme B-like [Colossoma macropomum]|uniref:granzyme B-like n=1 Tax=Colossoma macropomum TaxID=42526 RepID=UPI0018642F1A|nr:granzyme B-like [Colossoma macropomum]
MVFTCLLLFAALLPCLSHSASVSVGIVNGTEAEPHSRPYMVSLQENGKHHCGGFLVSESFVMSAAHCWNNGMNLTVVIGAHDLDNCNYYRIPVKFYHVYPGYRRLYNDIMLLELEKPAQRSKTVEWISIPKTNKDVEANTICSIAGWGKNSSEGPSSSRLLEADVSVIETKKCKSDWGQYFSESSMLCAGSGRGFCRGGAGGPLVCNNIAVGIMSFHESGNCDKPTVPNVYTKISQFLPWIKEIINDTMKQSINKMFSFCIP